MVGIYKITSPSGRIYIGQSVKIHRRLSDYKGLRNVDRQRKLYNSFLKYGVLNHTFEVLIECNVDELNEQERYYQELFNTIKSGLNCVYTQTNDRSGFTSDETRLKISIAKKGQGKGIPKSESFKKSVSEHNSKRIWKQSSRDKISKSMKGKFIGEKNPFFGKKHTQETKDLLAKKRLESDIKPMLGKFHTTESKNKMSKSHKGKNLLSDNPNSKIVLNISNGIFYECVKEIAILENICRHSLARKIRGDRKNNTNYIYV